MTSTVAINPFKVGRMVYPTLGTALAAITRAKRIYPDAPMLVIYTPTGEIAANIP